MSVIFESTWLFPALEIVHVAGIVLWVGSIALVDFRLMGISRTMPLRPYHLMTPAYVGFTLTVATGLLFVAGRPDYLSNTAFLAKMALIVAAGGLSLVVHTPIASQFDDMREEAALPGHAPLVGAVSLLLWTGVLVAGRMIPYVGTGL